MKKILSVLILTSLLVMPAISFADTYTPPTNPSDVPKELLSTPQDLVTLINTIGNWVFAILMGISVIVLILAGFFWITSGGEPAKVTKASDMLRNALIGVAVALGAKGLVAVIHTLLGG